MPKRRRTWWPSCARCKPGWSADFLVDGHNAQHQILCNALKVALRAVRMADGTSAVPAGRHLGGALRHFFAGLIDAVSSASLETSAVIFLLTPCFLHLEYAPRENVAYVQLGNVRDLGGEHRG